MLFRKKKKKNIEHSEVLKNYDYLINLLRKNNSINIAEITDLRLIIQKIELDSTQFEIINDRIIDLNSKESISKEEFDILRERINNMFWKKRKNVDLYDKNQQIVDQLVSQISNDINELTLLNEKIDSALDSKKEAEWKVLNSKKNILLKSLAINKKSLDNLLTKTSNLKIANELKQVQKINDILLEKSNILDTEKLVNIMDQSNILLEETLQEAQQIDSIIERYETVDSFDAAYEQYLLNKESNKSVAQKNNRNKEEL